MRLPDKVIVPPTCPVLNEKFGMRSGDIRNAYMTLHAGDCVSDQQGNDTTTEVFVSFYTNPRDEDQGIPPFLVTSPSLLVPIDSPTSNAARDLYHATDHGQGIERLQLQAELCRRVATCRGVVDGECWALGPKGLGEAILKIAGESGQQ
jgi:hypothetical protein